MRVTIHYCNACQLRLPAEQIAEALEREFSIAAELKEGFWGTFRIEADGEDVFNRWTHRGLLGRLGFGRTPTPEEICERFRQQFGFAGLPEICPPPYAGNVEVSQELKEV